MESLSKIGLNWGSGNVSVTFLEGGLTRLAFHGSGVVSVTFHEGGLIRLSLIHI